MNGYQFVKTLECTAFGYVWETRKEGNSHAMKMVHVLNGIAKLEEALAGRIRFSSPFLVKYIESFKHPVYDNLLFVSMEISRGNLAKLINELKSSKINELKSSKIDFPHLMRIFIEMLLGVRELCINKIGHPILKSQDILVDESFNIKICDFDFGNFIPTIENRQTFLEKMPYVSPESLQNKPHGERSDLWAVGVIMYQLASSELPFVTESKFLYPNVVLNEPFKPLSKQLGFPEEFLDIVHSLLVKDPLKRPSIDILLNNRLIREFAGRLELIPGNALLTYFPPDLAKSGVPVVTADVAADVAKGDIPVVAPDVAKGGIPVVTPDTSVPPTFTSSPSLTPSFSQTE